MEEIQKLYDVLVRDGYYTKSLDDFIVQYQDPAYVDKVFEVVTRDGLYTKDRETFDTQFSIKKKENEQPQEEPDTVSELELGFSELPSGEKDTLLERTFGKNFVTDYFGDIYRAGAQGFAQGATVDDALKLFASGKDADSEDIQDYIAAVQNMESYQPSDEMKEFDRIYRQEGGGLMGFIKGLAKTRAQVIPQIFTSSMIAMFNKGSLAAGAVGGVGAGLATGGLGAIPGAIAGLSGALETGVSFTEFLKEEIGDKPFTEENIREVLEDPGKLAKIRARAGARGVSIAALDAIAGGVASKVGAKFGKNLSKAGVTLTAGAIEGVGGGTGEVVARALADQEMDVAEIGFEAVAGTATAPYTVGAALYNMPKYQIGGKKLTRKDFIKTINESTPKQIIEIANSKAPVEVNNDKEALAIYNNAYQEAQIKVKTEEVAPNINEEELNKVVELTRRKEFLENNASEVAKAELSDINKQIKDITDAVRKRSSEEVVLQEQTEVGTDMGERDSTREVARKTTPEENQETEVQEGENIQAQETNQEEVAVELTEEQQDEVSDLEYTLNITEETTETTPDDIPTLPRDLTIEQVVEQGRQNGFSDASIRAVLLKRKNPQQNRRYSAAEVNEAMQIDLEKNEVLPAAIQNIEGGVEKGRQLLREVNAQIESFKNKTQKETKSPATNAQIREKALEFLRANEIFKSLNENEQLEVTLAFDKTLQTRANPRVQQEISRIKSLVRGFKRGVKDLRSAQIQLKNFIRNNLKQADNLLPLITGVKSVKDLSAQAEQVIKRAERQRAQQKKSLIKEIEKFINKKSKGRKTASRKTRAATLDAQGKDFFTELKRIFKLDAKQLDKLREEINENETEYNKAVLKEARGEKLDRKDTQLLDTKLAFDLIAGIENKSIEEIEVLFEDLKTGAKESLNRLNRAKDIQAQRQERISNTAQATVKKLYGFLFGEDGKPLTKAEIKQKRKQMLRSFGKLKIFEGTKAFAKIYGPLLTINAFRAIRNSLGHLGSITEILDRYEPGFFKEQLYDNVNVMEEKSLQGKYRQIDELNKIANTISGIKKGYNEILGKFKKTDIEIIVNGKKEIYSDDNLLRIYALSLNETQRQKLNKQGFTDKVLSEIEKKLDPSLIEFADKVVEYFSTRYYESVNDVYSSVNNINLSYVDNYFPTRTVSDKVNQQWFNESAFDKIFAADSSPAFRDRTDTQGKVDVDDMFTFTNVMMDHITSMERYKAFAQGVRDINTIMTDPAVNILMQQTGTEKVIRQSLNSIFNPTYGVEENLSLFSGLFNQFTGYALSFKVIQIPKQISSFVNAFEEYQYFKGKNTPGIDHIAFMVDTLKVLGSLFTKDSAYKKALDISATFRERVERGLEGDIYGLETGGTLNLKQVQAFKEIRKKFRKLKGAPTVIGDIGGVLGYMINYNRNIANGMSEADALKAFNNYNATQQSRRGSDKIALQRSKSQLLRTVTMFGSTAFLQMNKAATGLSAIMKRISKGQFKKAVVSKEARAVALNLGVANLLFVFAANFTKYALGDDEDKEEVASRLRDALYGLNLLYQVPLFGDGIESMMRSARGQKPRTGGGVNPFLSIANELRKSPFTKETAFQKFKPFIEIGLGTRLDPFVGLYNIIEKGEFEEDDVLDLIGISSSYRPNPDKRLTKTQLKEYLPELYDELYGPGSAYDEMKKEMRKIKNSLKK